MNDEQLLRYSRQIMLPDVDLDGQATGSHDRWRKGRAGLAGWRSFQPHSAACLPGAGRAPGGGLAAVSRCHWPMSEC